MARRGARRQHAQRRRDRQIDPEEDEGGRNWLKFQPQSLPTSNFRQCERGHPEHSGDGAEDPAPNLPRHHRAETQELSLSGDLQQIKEPLNKSVSTRPRDDL